MKATALKPHNRKKPRYGLKAFVWGAVIAALFIVPSIIMDNGMFLYYGDYNCQVIPFYQVMHDAIRGGEFGWNWYTDLGTSLVGGYGYYSLGSPFFWLMLPFPKEAIPYLMGPLTILKFACSSFTAYIFLKRYTKDKNNAVIGAMLYAFSGFAIYNLVFHFLDIFVFFPLLLASLDSFIFEKKRGRFAVMVAVCAIVNYYFFVAEAVFCLIYWIVRMAAKNIKMEVREVLYLMFEAVMGVGIALFMLLPCFYSIMSNTRVSGENGLNGWQLWVYENVYAYAKIIISFFCPPDLANATTYVTGYSSEWLSITCYLPLFSMAGVFAIIFNKRRNRWLRTFYAVCTVFMFVPVLNSSFQLFTDATYLRWFFMLLLVMSLGSVMALEDPATKWKRAISANLVGVVLIALIIGFTPLKTTTEEGSIIQIGISGGGVTFWMYIAVALLNIALCVLLVSLYKKNRTAFKRFSCIITSVAIIVAFASSFVFGKIIGYKTADIVGMNMVNCGDNIEIDDIQQWRSDVVTETNYSAIMYDYDSIKDIDFEDAEKLSKWTYDRAVGETDDYTAYENDNLTMYWGIPGFECFHSTVSGSIMDFVNGLGFERTTLSNWQTSYYGFRSLFSVKYMFCRDGSLLSFEDENGKAIMPGWEYYDTQNGYDIYENQYCLPMGFTYDKYITAAAFEDVPAQFKHLAMMDAMVIDSVDDMFELTATGLDQVFEEEFDYTEAGYYESYERRMSLTCYDFERDADGFQAKIDTNDNDEYVFFSVPYDNGWSATVNGEKAEIMKANFGFMAVKVPANQTSTIRFDYHTPGTVYGVFVSILSVVLLLIYLAAIKIQSMPPAEEEPSGNTHNGDGKGGISGDTVSDENEESTEQTDEEEELTVFDIVKQTEEETMMHTYSRVPVILEKGYGSTAYDVDGKKYIDFTSGIGVNCLGFADGRWNDSVEKQLNDVQHTSNLYYNITQIQLAETLCIKTGYSKVFFANSGAEANECAIKVARKYGSDKYGRNHTHIVTLQNSFHGRTITTLSATGQDTFHQYFHPFTEGFSYAKANDIESVKNEVKEDTCAVMIELVQGEGGVNPLDKEFVTQLAQFCKEHDILLIVDEIQTGIGRTGKLFCYENYDIKPDIITSAKALAGGLPLSACLCTKELENVMTPGSNGTTFGGNTVACAGALRVLNIVSDEEFLKEVNEKGEYMRKRIKSMKGVKEVRGIGMMIGIVLEKDNAKEVLNRCAENGLLVLTAKNLIRLLPPLNIEYYDIDEGLDILEDTILETMQDEENESEND